MVVDDDESTVVIEFTPTIPHCRCEYLIERTIFALQVSDLWAFEAGNGSKLLAVEGGRGPMFRDATRVVCGQH